MPTPSAEQAVLEAEENGEETFKTKDAAGNELLQRPISISTTPSAPAKGKRGRKPRPKTSGMVKVYNKANGCLFTSTGPIGPNAEAMVAEEDLEKYPLLKKYLIKLA